MINFLFYKIINEVNASTRSLYFCYAIIGNVCGAGEMEMKRQLPSKISLQDIRCSVGNLTSSCASLL